MKRYIAWLLSVALVLASVVTMHASPGENHEEEGIRHGFVHPFSAHMGVPDEPGEVSLRLTGYRSRYMGEVEGDIAVHVEAGLIKRLGLHIRSEGVLHQDYSEVMLQYAPLLSPDYRHGLALFGQISIPTGEVAENEFKWLVGVSNRLTWSGIMVWDANVHFNPSDLMAEFESSFVFRASERFYPLLETGGHVQFEEMEVEPYVLPGIKFRIGEHSAFGVGLQLPLLEHREYDSRALITYDVAF